MNRSLLSAAVFAGMLGVAACGGGEEAGAGGDAGFEATGGADMGGAATAPGLDTTMTTTPGMMGDTTAVGADTSQGAGGF